MSRLGLPIDMLTSRLNLGERFEGVRSQSVAQRFSNLKPIGEFLDLKRLSKPRDFSDVQSRVNYNLGYFSSNYAVIFVMLSIYALLTNTWLLFDIVFVSVGMWVVGRLGGRDLEIGTFRASSSQLYTGIACISIPIAIFSGPIGTFLWLTYRGFFFGGGGRLNGQHAHQRGGQPRAPYDMPYWGRPPGVRTRGDRDEYHGVNQFWDNDEGRFHEVPPEDEDAYLHSDPRMPYGANGRFQSDELFFDGIDVDTQTYAGHRRSGGYYHDDSEYLEAENYYRHDQDYPLHREDSRSSMPIEKEEDLVAKALDRIARARALGKNNVKLSQAEIDALERLERSKTEKRTVPIPRAAPASKKTATKKAIEASKTKGSHSPKARPVEGLVRNRSRASSRSTREDEMAIYPVSSEPDHYHTGRAPHAIDPRSAYQGSPLRPAGSRSNSYSNIRHMAGAPPMYAPYYQNQRIVSPPEGSYYSHPDPHRSRAGSGRSDHSSRSRSNSHLRSMPLDQLPNPAQTARGPRFDPTDPRFASPSRRGASGSPYGAAISRRESDEMFLGVPHPHEAGVMDYRAANTRSRSSSESDGSLYEPPVTVDFSERPGTKAGYAVKTRSAAATSSSKSTSKSNTKATVRRR